jgi:hypothetical protein
VNVPFGQRHVFLRLQIKLCGVAVGSALSLQYTECRKSA